MDLETIASALAPRLLAYARARTACRSLAEDIAQDALTALVQRWRRHGPPDSPEAFTFAIARRRAGRAMARRALLAPLEALVGLARPDGDAGVAYEHRQELAVVLRAIRQLPRRDRDVLLLSAAGELRIPEIASVTGATPAAVKMRLHRARQRLAAQGRAMNTDDTLSEVDDRVRRAVQPDEAAVQRVLSRALHGTGGPPPSVRRSRTIVTIVIIAFLGAGLWRWAVRARRSPETTTLTITGSRTFVVVQRGDGRRWVVAHPADRQVTGSYVILVER